jgi:hypothetical protein
MLHQKIISDGIIIHKIERHKKTGGRRFFSLTGVGRDYLSYNFSKIFLASWRWKLSGFEATTINWSIALSF